MTRCANAKRSLRRTTLALPIGASVVNRTSPTAGIPRVIHRWYSSAEMNSSGSRAMTPRLTFLAVISRTPELVFAGVFPR